MAPLTGDAPSCSLASSQLVGAALTEVMVTARMLKSKAEVGQGGGIGCYKPVLLAM